LKLSAILLFLGGVFLGDRVDAAEKPKTQAGEIAELRKEIAALREENRRLRRLLVENADDGPLTEKPRAKASPVPAPTGAARDKANATSSHWLSEGGKRHNRRCRYFKGAGRPCGKNEGTACKVCGG
jgi:hypothetical protein